MEDSKYQIGDTVTIKRLSSEDDNAGMYRFGLNDEMIASSGKSFKIEDIQRTANSPGKLPDDGYRYKLEGSRWSWASSMFEDTTKSSIFESGPTAIDAFINKKKCPVLDFTLH